ncbi:MAG: hypothetical protein ACRDUW_12550 [Pseudonocardiaceae bacterium]
MMTMPDRVWYYYRTDDDIDQIVAQHLINDEPIERLIIQPAEATPLNRPPSIDPTGPAQ